MRGTDNVCVCLTQYDESANFLRTYLGREGGRGTMRPAVVTVIFKLFVGPKNKNFVKIKMLRSEKWTLKMQVVDWLIDIFNKRFIFFQAIFSMTEAWQD